MIKDESIFQGVHEFRGLRFMARGSGHYSVYEAWNDVCAAEFEQSRWRR